MTHINLVNLCRKSRYFEDIIYKSWNFLLEVILQLFPGLVMGWWIGSAMGWWVGLVGWGGGVGLVFGVEAHCLVVFNSKWLEFIDFSYLCLLEKGFINKIIILSINSTFYCRIALYHKTEEICTKKNPQSLICQDLTELEQF